MLTGKTQCWAPHKHTCTLTLHLLTTGCYAIITHTAFKDSTWAISSLTNDPRHSWWQSNNHPARPQTFKHLNFPLMKSAKLMSWITMKTLCFFHIKPTLWMKTWNSGLYRRSDIAEREIVLWCPQMTTDLPPFLYNSSGSSVLEPPWFMSSLSLFSL